MRIPTSYSVRKNNHASNITQRVTERIHAPFLEGVPIIFGWCFSEKPTSHALIGRAAAAFPGNTIPQISTLQRAFFTPYVQASCLPACGFWPNKVLTGIVYKPIIRRLLPKLTI
jgi:hypothetical protein